MKVNNTNGAYGFSVCAVLSIGKSTLSKGYWIPL